MKKRPNKTVSRAKSAKDAKVDFDKKTWNGRGFCELSVLGAINFLTLVMFNNPWAVSNIQGAWV